MAVFLFLSSLAFKLLTLVLCFLEAEHWLTAPVPQLGVYVMLSPYLGFVHAYSPMITVSMECNVFTNTVYIKARCGSVDRVLA